MPLLSIPLDKHNYLRRAIHLQPLVLSIEPELLDTAKVYMNTSNNPSQNMGEYVSHNIPYISLQDEGEPDFRMYASGPDLCGDSRLSGPQLTNSRRNDVLAPSPHSSDQSYNFWNHFPGGSYLPSEHGNMARQSSPPIPINAYGSTSHNPSHTWSPESTLNSATDLFSPQCPATSAKSLAFSLPANPTYNCWDLNSYGSHGISSPSSVDSTTEFTNVFDFDFAHALLTENVASSSGLLAPPTSSPRQSNSAPSSCISSPASRITQLSDLPRQKSRDVSPSSSTEGDPQNHRRRFPCIIPGCTRRFTSQYTLKVHVEAHKPKPRVSFPCTLGCSERFSRQHDRLRHEVAKHGKVCEFSCDECGRFFSTKKTLGNHKCPVAQGGTRWVNS